MDADGDPVYDDPPDDMDSDDAYALGPNGERVAPATGKQKMIDTLCAFDVSYAPISSTNIVTLAQALQIAAQLEWVSDETATTELGFDYGIEQKRLKRERMSKAEEVAAGLRQAPPMMPGADTGEGGGADEGESDNADAGETEDEMTNARSAA
jgi:hypothetical protein